MFPLHYKTPSQVAGCSGRILQVKHNFPQNQNNSPEMNVQCDFVAFNRRRMSSRKHWQNKKINYYKINIELTFCNPDLLQLTEVLEEFWKLRSERY